VAEHRASIDLRTLQEVHRLLAASDFATPDDLTRRGGTDHLAAGLHRPRSAASTPSLSAEPPALAPLPRRQ
jgi:hypothetical protein